CAPVPRSAGEILPDTAFSFFPWLDSFIHKVKVSAKSGQLQALQTRALTPACAGPDALRS
ncbi:MAG: hypothetical protein WCZ18_12320, partial [Ottowia sp.]|nr:hypothetical protein [Ottowia sp.]